MLGYAPRDLRRQLGQIRVIAELLPCGRPCGPGARCGRLKLLSANNLTTLKLTDVEVKKNPPNCQAHPENPERTTRKPRIAGSDR